MQFPRIMLGIWLGLVSFSMPSTSEVAPKPTALFKLPLKHFSRPLPRAVIRSLVMAYDPYDECVGPGPYIFPRKTAGGRDVEKIGLGADPTIFPYGTRIKFHDPKICRFIRQTDPNDEDAQACIATVDDTGKAAWDDTAHEIYHLEFRVIRRTPNEDAHARAMLFPRRDDVEIEIVSMP